jgi:hypothetical protein
MAWKVAPIFPVGDESVHIFPLEGKEHQTDPCDQECWCAPRLETNPAGVVLVIHRELN